MVLPEAYLPKTLEAKGVACGRLAEARRRSTLGPEGCGQDVRNWQQARDGLSVSHGSQAYRPQSSSRKRWSSPGCYY